MDRAQYSQGRFSGRGPKGWRRSDERIREDVNERLTMHPDIDATDIDVQVRECEVVLLGVVDDRHAKRLAEEIAEGISGVKDVNNQIRVRRTEDRSRDQGSFDTSTPNRDQQRIGQQSGTAQQTGQYSGRPQQTEQHTSQQHQYTGPTTQNNRPNR